MFSWFRPRQKRCGHCKQKKLPVEFHSDACRPDGLATSCIVCRNKQRRDREKRRKNVRDLIDSASVNDSKNTYKIEKVLSPKKVIVRIAPQEEPTDLNSYFQAVMDRHQAHFSVSMTRDGIFRLQTHGEHNKHWKHHNLLELLQLASAKE